MTSELMLIYDVAYASRPMPRARAHIQSLLESYRQQCDQIVALQRQIAQVSCSLRNR